MQINNPKIIKMTESLAELAFRSFRSGEIEKSLQAYKKIIDISAHNSFDEAIQTYKDNFYLMRAQEREYYAGLVAKQKLQDADRSLAVIGDSLCIPRGKQGMFIEEKPTCYGLELQLRLRSQNIKRSVEVYGQRWSNCGMHSTLIQEKNFEGYDLLIHTGLVESVNRITSERQRFFISCLSSKVQKRLNFLEMNMGFQQAFMDKFGAVNNLSAEEIRKAFIDIFDVACKIQVRSLSFLTVLNIRTRENPEELDIRCNANNYNQILREFAQDRPVNYFDLNSIIGANNCEELLLPDRMHFNLDGHQKVADFLFPLLCEQGEGFLVLPHSNREI